MPSERTFHKIRCFEKMLFLFGGTNGRRQNDCFTIALGQGLQKNQKSSLKFNNQVSVKLG